MPRHIVFLKKAASPLHIRLQDIDLRGIVADICNEMNLVKQINRLLGIHPQKIISAGQVLKKAGGRRQKEQLGNSKK
ncbi:DUF4277 domain-containing protein [Nostoc sp. UIC 10607]|uniref:DUF4277 domain-containing protein n=1 Tax=Nostoc sp. UIC 10607 TaxID=3045935 RepID=UPI0039A3A836